MGEVKVSTQFIGRLGNNMFQIAAAIGYAKKYRCGWGAPWVSNEVPRLREFFPAIKHYEGNEFQRYNCADPSQFNYSPIQYNERGIKLVGFFQSEKYFEGAHDEIRRFFKLDIQPNEKVSIHVRRGDYAGDPTNFPPIPVGYIQQAVSFFREKGHDNFIVCSDDPVWCRAVLPAEIREANFDFTQGTSEFEDLSLMASCKHNIIANSTFSWWAAWLNPNPDKIVVSPHHETWFGPNNGVKKPPVDLIPSSWIQIRTR